MAALTEAFQTYVQMYYDSGLVTIYFSRIDSNSFTVTILIKKTVEGAASWDSIHVIECEKSKEMMSYRATCSVILSFSSSSGNDSKDGFYLGGTLYRQSIKEAKFTSLVNATSHIVHIGTIVEEAESKLRSSMQEVYFVRVKEVILGQLRRPLEANEIRMVSDRQQ